jgi:hypothetical protein
MKYYGKAVQTIGQIMQAFENPQSLPKPLAAACIRIKDIPCANWSFRNRFILATKGVIDARGINQWGEVGRRVKKGEKAHYILAPCVKKQEGGKADEEDKRIVYGFRAIPVFALEQTDGADLPANQTVGQAFIHELPLLEVAKEWGLEVKAVPSNPRWKGQYVRDRAIRLAVENAAVWAHELCHAAEDRLIGLKGGQHWRQEIVAELGGAVLLTMLGQHVEADLGGCREYVMHYAAKAKMPLIEAVSKMIERTCAAVDLVSRRRIAEYACSNMKGEKHDN